MNVDLAIHKLAYQEADTLAFAQALIARRQNEVSLKVVELRAEAAQPVPDADGGLSLLGESPCRGRGQGRSRPNPTMAAAPIVDKTA